MPALTPDQINDFVTLTLPKFQKYKWTDLSLQYPEYVASRIINDKKVTEQGGPTINFKLQSRNTGLAKNTGMFAQDVTAVEDVMISASIPWSKQTTNWSYDVDEDEFQSDGETIVREMLVREHDALNSMVELQEENLWSAPTGPTDNRPMGIPFWLQKDATTTPEGAFNGGNPAGFTAGAAGIDSNTYTRWRNWTFGYTNPTTDDLVRKVKTAKWRTGFRAPVPHPEIGFGKSDYTIFTTYRVVEPLERLAETRNDNLGPDLAKYQGMVTIGGTPLEAVHYLTDNDTSDPLYGVNWKTFRPFVKSGRNMLRSKPTQAPKQHTVFTVFIDNWMNYACYNRRLTFVGSR